ncbi:MAG: hypothetical protein WA461_07730 [Nitrososphaeraceae archaeon]
MSTQKNNGEESKELDYDEDNDQLEENQEEESRQKLSKWKVFTVSLSP